MDIKIVIIVLKKYHSMQAVQSWFVTVICKGVTEKHSGGKNFVNMAHGTFKHMSHCGTMQKKLMSSVRQGVNSFLDAVVCCKSLASQVLLNRPKEIGWPVICKRHVKQAATSWLQGALHYFLLAGIQAFVPQWDECLNVNSEYSEV
jgi:hypothetical protein